MLPYSVSQSIDSLMVHSSSIYTLLCVGVVCLWLLVHGCRGDDGLRIWIRMPVFTRSLCRSQVGENVWSVAGKAPNGKPRELKAVVTLW